MNSPYGLPADGLDCHMRSDDFLSALSPESLAAFNQIKRATGLPEGAVIFVEGQVPRGIFMLCEGQVMGTSRESITRILSEFRKKDIVELKDSILIIHNKPALEQFVAA